MTAILTVWTCHSSEPSSGNTTNALPGMRAEVKIEAGPGLTPTALAFLTVGTNKFVFKVPPGFRLSPSASDEIAMATPDLNSTISFRLVGPAPFANGELKPDFCRDLVLGQFSDAKIVAEFTLAGMGLRGPAFELQLSGRNGLTRRIRALFIQSQAGLLEFTLSCTRETFEQAKGAFNGMLGTLQASDADGKLFVPRFPEKS